jgi:hypothetical protein
MIYNEKPPHIQNCLAYSYPYPCCEPNIAYYFEYREGWYWHSGVRDKVEVTHWMTLPPSPQEQEEEMKKFTQGFAYRPPTKENE